MQASVQCTARQWFHNPFSEIIAENSSHLSGRNMVKVRENGSFEHPTGIHLEESRRTLGNARHVALQI